MAKAKKEKQELTYHATVINEISEEAATNLKNFVVYNILHDTFIFNIKLEDGTVKRMTLNELVEYRENQKKEFAEKKSSALLAKAKDSNSL